MLNLITNMGGKTLNILIMYYVNDPSYLTTDTNSIAKLQSTKYRRWLYGRAQCCLPIIIFYEKWRVGK